MNFNTNVIFCNQSISIYAILFFCYPKLGQKLNVVHHSSSQSCYVLLPVKLKVINSIHEIEFYTLTF